MIGTWIPRHNCCAVPISNHNSSSPFPPSYERRQESNVFFVGGILGYQKDVSLCWSSHDIHQQIQFCVVKLQVSHITPPICPAVAWSEISRLPLLCLPCMPLPLSSATPHSFSGLAPLVASIVPTPQLANVFPSFEFAISFCLTKSASCSALAKIVAPHLHLLFFSCFIIELCRVSEHGILRAAKERHHAVSIVCGTADGAGTTKDASTSSSRLTWRVQV